MFALLDIARIYKALNCLADLQGPTCYKDAQNTEMKSCHAILKGAGAVAWQRVGSQSLFSSSIMADDFTCILRDEFKRFIEELPYEELRQSIFTEELEVADRLLALSERICREFVFFLRIFESRNCDLRLRNAKPRPSS